MTNIFRKRLAFPAQNIYLYRPNNSINHTTMMKQTLLPACAAFLLLAGSAQAQTATIEGIEYTVDMYVKTAVVTNAEHNIKTANVLATVNIDGTDYAVTAIGDNAFRLCYALQSVTLHEGVQTIGEDAFAYCPLRSITSLAATPPAIENSTFDYDTYATATLTVPEGAEDAYRAAEGWKLFYTSMAIDGIAYTIDTEVGTATVTDYRGSKRDVAVPATVKYEGADYPVTVIGDFAFSYCSALQSITLPEGVQSIGDNAFQSCTALQSVTLPKGLQAIGTSAFYSCSALQSVTFPQGLQNIGESAFTNCTALQSVTLPERLQSIGRSAFSYCTALQSVTFPQELQNIGTSAFFNCPLRSITSLAATPPAIENGTFDYDTYATATLTVPEGTEAAYRAAEGWKLFFYSTKTDGIIYTVDAETQTAIVTDADANITTANVLATVEYEGTEYPVTAIGDGAFSGCAALRSVTLPEGLQNIGERAFSYCDALQSVTLPERLKNIGEKAFHECPLKDITCHAVAPPAISEDVFEYIVYATANLNVAIEAENAYRATEGWELFYSSMAIDGIAYTIDTETGTAYVSGAIPDITTANIPAKIEYEGTNHPVTAIGYEAFQNCTALQSVTIPEGVTTLCDYAFSECESLQSVTLPQGLVTIGGYVFRTCISLKDVILPEGLTSIGKYSFIQCRSLESIHLPSTLQSVGHDAFRCPLKDIVCQGTTPASLDYHVFDKDTYVSATLHVPSGAEAAYYAAKGWRYFAPKAEVNGIVYALNPYNHDAAVFTGPQYAASVTIPSTISYEGSTYTVDDIGIEAFFYRNALQSVTLPEGLQTIGDGAFSGCSALQSVTLPEGLQNIGERAFSYCDALQSITLPEELQTIGESAFTNCTALQSVTLPEGLQSIEDYAFYWCKSLQNIILPSTLQSIGTQGFAYCPLTDVYAYTTRPPVIDESTFSENAYATATLHVPSDVTSDYQAAEYWKEFLLIVGDLPSTAISSVATDASLATYAGGILTTESPAAITVYAQNGAQALHTSAATSLSLAGLPGGIYIICIDMEGQRQVMKVAR